MTIRQLVGDCRALLTTLEPGSVQTCITSPPYWGLRDYGTPPLVWGGDAEHAHKWGADGRRTYGNLNENFNNRWNADWAPGGKQTDARPREVSQGQFCACGSWLGSLGLEPDPAMYVEHIVECFRHVKRVLRDDSTLWLNLGDSYAGSGKGPSNSVQSDASQIGPSARSKQTTNVGSLVSTVVNVPGYKPKDLMMIPFRVAMALQADGWYLRSVIPWLKRNSMPESVTDRPSTSVEYVFLLSKSSRYFWDVDAVRIAWADGRQGRDGSNLSSVRNVGGRNDGFTKPNGIDPSQNGGRNLRNADFFFQTWQGLLLNEQDDPLALVVNPQPFSGSHFAVFPPKLVEPMVKASTRPGDVILDPFGGAGTVGLVADRLGRNAVLVDLKPEYSTMAVDRLTGDAPLFVEVTEAPA